jgi:organic radical activating enzyme
MVFTKNTITKLITRHKNLLYLIIFLKNILKYTGDKKVKMNLLEIWTGNKCNLRCKHCLHLISHLNSGSLYNMDGVVGDLKTMLDCVSVNGLEILGGEPFLHPEICKLLDYTAECKYLPKVEIITNGTIRLNEKVIERLKKSPKFKIYVNFYPGYEDNSENFVNVLARNGIAYTKYYTKDSNYTIVDKPDDGKINAEALSSCTLKNYGGVLADGVLAQCPRSVTTQLVHGYKANSFELYNVRNKHPLLRKAFIATARSKAIVVKDCCRYCAGYSALNTNRVPAAEQINH